MPHFMKVAAASANKPIPSAYYDGIARMTRGNVDAGSNPVLKKLDQELHMYIAYMRKRASPEYSKPKEEAFSRPSDVLFEIWNKYCPLLPELYYQRKVIEMGEFLMTLKEYALADRQCFSRYLDSFGNMKVESILDVDTFKSAFFPQGFDAPNAGFTFQALMGKSVCLFELVKHSDPQLQNTETLADCLRLLSFLRLVTQVILPKDELCWLVYNGTVHIYSVSRHLMAYGHSGEVLEFVLWASMCMEASVPLLGKRYLVWRSTLYAAVCQCYYDCKAPLEAEAFGRRALNKINELSQLENLSSEPPSTATEEIFRQATVKMAVMVFKRSCFETRKKPKGILRPKARTNLKDVLTLPWPRTPTEKLLVDMFEGSAAQFLCILETLSDSNRRTLITSPAAPEGEVEILDVYAELFMAAQELLCGGGGTMIHQVGFLPNRQTGLVQLPGIEMKRSFSHLISTGQNGVPLASVVKLVKLAYCYEQWDIFSSLADNVRNYISHLDNSADYLPELKSLEILGAMVKLNQSRRRREEQHEAAVAEKEREREPSKGRKRGSGTTNGKGDDVTGLMDKEKTNQSMASRDGSKSHLVDELMGLAEVLESITSHPSITKEYFDLDMLVDATLFLWNKTKVIFHKFQTGSLDNWKYLHKMETPTKWIYILEIIHKACAWSFLSSVDPGLTSEVALRLALVLEASASSITSAKSAGGHRISIGGESEHEDSMVMHSKVHGGRNQPSDPTHAALKEEGGGRGDIGSQPTSILDHQTPTSSILEQPVREQLTTARNILELGLKSVSSARQTVALSDGKAIADIAWSKELNNELFSSPEVVCESSLDGEEKTGKQSSPSTSTPFSVVKDQNTNTVWTTVKDLHIEMFFMYHRVCIKLLNLPSEYKPVQIKPFTRSTCSAIPPPSAPEVMSMQSRKQEDMTYIASESELMEECGQSHLVKAMLHMQLALTEGQGSLASERQRASLDTAHRLILRAQTEEKRVYMENSVEQEYGRAVHHGKVPPPPLLLCRTEATMTFKPAPFKPAGGEKVAWYRIFGRTANGSNIKVRMNDYNIPGSGNEVPFFNCVLRVTGLDPFERYVFAVAAYTSEGVLIGGSIGETGKPLLTSHPLPILMAWAYLCQVAYQTGHSTVAKEGCRILWEHFVAKPTENMSEFSVTSSHSDFGVKQLRLNKKLLDVTSPILLRMFLASIFIYVEIKTKERRLFCDSLSDQGPVYAGQISRLQECEKMVVAMELSGWLTEPNLALQAVIQCYGLLAPVLFWKIPSLPVIQILERCHAVLQEIPSGLRLRRPGRVSASVHHMTACLTYHLTKVLRSWGQRALAAKLNDAGRALLNLEEVEGGVMAGANVGGAGSAGEGKKTEDGDSEAIDGKPALNVAALKKKKSGKQTKSSIGKDEEVGGNSELKALEAHMLKLSKQAQSEHELTGGEDPSILNAYIAYLPSRIAYKEVVKFKRRARYLEFFVQVVQKAISEGFSDTAIEWCEEALLWITKRNEMVIGSKAIVNKQLGAVVVAGEDPKKFAAAMVEYNKQKDMSSPRGKPKGGPGGGGTTRRKPKYKLLAFQGHLTREQKIAAEEKQIAAVEKFAIHLPDAWKTSTRRKRFRKICTDENPWRGQLNIVLGLSHFSVFLNKLELREKVLGTRSSAVYSASFMDPEWFTFETAGTLVLGIDGGPKRSKKNREPINARASLRIFHDGSSLYHGEKGKSIRASTTLERAAFAAVGIEPPRAAPPLQQQQETSDRLDSPSSDREGEDSRQFAGRPDVTLLSSRITRESLSNTFTYLKRAIVLAHRGQHWILLQNAVHALWNASHTASIRAFTSDPADNSGLLPQDSLKEVFWQPFHCAADHWLDMMLHLEQQTYEQKRKSTDDPLGPSVSVGDVEAENGGTSLRFESCLDDQTKLNHQFTRRLILRTMEYLFYQERWEKLVDIGLRFTAFTGNRYYDSVLPMVILAQRKLTERLLEYGEVIPQAHFVTAQQELGVGNGPIGAGLYTRELQLRLNLARDGDLYRPKISRVKTEVNQFDPDSLAGIRDVKKSQRMLSVPLEVEETLEVFRENLEKAQYNARSLHHSRSLLALYLGGQQNASLEGMFPQPSHGISLEFAPYTAEPQYSSAPELKDNLFLSEDEVQTVTLPKAHLPLVIESYERTIDMLNAHSRRSLSAQAMHELGNIHYHQGNLRVAYRWWCESLDMTLGVQDSLANWRSAFSRSNDISSALLQKCGLWGCLLGGVVASNISQYVLTSDLSMRTECCFLAGYLFKGLLRSSLPHPTADRDYALYDIGEGYDVTSLVPGIDLLSDRFRADGRSVVAALRWVTEELSRGRYNLFVLPLLTLYQYFATNVCRDLQRTVDGRILKVRVLTDLHLFSEAVTVLLRLLYGDKLPLAGDNHFRQMDTRMPSVQFDSAKPLWDAGNSKTLEILANRKLSPTLSSLYGPNLTCHITIAQANLLTTVAATVPIIVESDNPIKVLARSKTRKNSEKAYSHYASTTGRSAAIGSRADSDVFRVDGKRPEDGGLLDTAEPPVSVVELKRNLLGSAEKMLTNLRDALMESTTQGQETLEAMELELVILCKLGLSEISAQRHHSAMAVKEAFTAMKLLRDSKIFSPPVKPVAAAPRPSTMKGKNLDGQKYGAKVKVTDQQNSQFQFQNFESRSRLDTRLWLQCRMALVKATLAQIRSMGYIKGPVTKVVVEVGECRGYCAEGVAEAEACGDVEMQAEFLMMGAQMNIMEGLSLEHTRPVLEEVLNLLTAVQQLSMSGRLLCILSLIQIADFDNLTMKTEDRMTLHNVLAIYLDAHESLLDQIQDLGDKIIRYKPASRKGHLSTPVSPLCNLYTPQCLQLAQIKLRIGQSICRKAFLDPDRNDALLAERYVGALSVLTTALDLTRVSAAGSAHIESETLLIMGKIQRQLYTLGRLPPSTCVTSLLKSIQLSLDQSHDLGLVRQAYLEIALAYMHQSKQEMNTEAESPEKEVEESETTTLSRSSSATTNLPGSAAKGKSRKSPTKQSKSRVRGGDTPGATGQGQATGGSAATARTSHSAQAAYVALHCAARVAAAQTNLSLLGGEAGHVAKTLEEEAWMESPQFACCDMMGQYVVGEKKVQYANWMEEEMADLVKTFSDKKLPSYEEEISSVLTESKDLTWIHYLGYHSILQRMTNQNTATLILKENSAGSTSLTTMTAGCNAVRYPLFCTQWILRAAVLHNFFMKHLPIYQERCAAPYPPKILQPMTPENDGSKEVITFDLLPLTSVCYTEGVNYRMPRESLHDNEDSGTVVVKPSGIFGSGGSKVPHPPMAARSLHVMDLDEKRVVPGENDVTLVWYKPSLQYEVLAGEHCLLYAVTKREQPRKDGQTACNCVWVPNKSVEDMHKKLLEFVRKSEVSLLIEPKRLAKRRDAISPVAGASPTIQKKEAAPAASPGGTPPPGPPQIPASAGSQSTSGGRAKTRTQTASSYRPTSPTIKIDDVFEGELKEGFQMIRTVLQQLGPSEKCVEEAGDEEQVGELPFDITRGRMRTLEHAFNPAAGCSISGGKLCTWVTSILPTISK